MLPIQKPATTFRSLEEIRARKEQLYEELQRDNAHFTTLWNQMFVKRENSTKGEYLTALIANSITAVDAFLLVRKLLRNYGGVFKRKKR